MNRRLPATERRRQILTVALEQFGVGGYDAASMVEIAEAAGVTKPVVYQHFDSKRALFLEVLADSGRRVGAAIEVATDTAASPRELVEMGFASFVSFFADHPSEFNVLFCEAARTDPEFSGVVEQVEEAVADRISSLLDDDTLSELDKRVVAHSIVGLAVGACRYWIDTDSDIEAGHLAKLLSRVAWTGLRGDRH